MKIKQPVSRVLLHTVVLFFAVVWLTPTLGLLVTPVMIFNIRRFVRQEEDRK